MSEYNINLQYDDDCAESIKDDDHDNLLDDLNPVNDPEVFP